MEDTIYYLSESLRKEGLDLEVFLKVTIMLATLLLIISSGGSNPSPPPPSPPLFLDQTEARKAEWEEASPFLPSLVLEISSLF